MDRNGIILQNLFQQRQRIVGKVGKCRQIELQITAICIYIYKKDQFIFLPNEYSASHLLHVVRDILYQYCYISNFVNYKLIRMYKAIALCSYHDWHAYMCILLHVFYINK